MTTAVTAAHPPLTAAFIGGGFMGTVHSRAARAAGAQLAGIATSSASSAAAAASALGIASSYSSTEELFADDTVDVVHVCTPNASHAEFALAALAAGKHVVCEKPLATTPADAQRLVDAAAATGLTATVPFVYRFHPMVREARARVASGSIGRLLTLQGSYLQDWLLDTSDDNWRVDTAQGGASRAFADIGSHLCDLVEFVTGDRITRLAATKRTVHTDRVSNSGIETEDAAALVVQTATGAIGTVLVSQVAPGRKNRLAIELHGSAESIGFDQEQPETLWLGRKAESAVLVREDGQLGADAARLSVLPAGHPLGYQDAFTAFAADTYAAIRGESRDGLPTFADGARAASLTQAVLDSSGSGSWVDVPEFVAAAVTA